MKKTRHNSKNRPPGGAAKPDRMARPLRHSPRCAARTRSGAPCRSHPVGGRNRCRMHGGAPGSGAPPGNRNALKQGRYTKAATADRRGLNRLARDAERLMAEFEKGP